MTVWQTSEVSLIAYARTSTTRVQRMADETLNGGCDKLIVVFESQKRLATLRRRVSE